jgi:hypothetical protein
MFPGHTDNRWPAHTPSDNTASKMNPRPTTHAVTVLEKSFCPVHAAYHIDIEFQFQELFFNSQTLV